MIVGFVLVWRSVYVSWVFRGRGGCEYRVYRRCEGGGCWSFMRC